MGKKIAFIGAGSFGFTRGLVNDILTYPAFADCTLCLMDIDPKKLSFIEKAVNKIVASSGLPVKIESTDNRQKALEGADGVLCTILNGGIDIWRNDIEIPKKYGIDTNIGDTRSVSGIFRYLRTAPVMLDICGDIAKYANKNVVFLNYTNPMAMLCRTMQGEFPGMCVTGLCHSVQGTAHMLAKWLGIGGFDEYDYMVDTSEFDRRVQYTCAGINHTAFYIDYKLDGEDAYPRLRQMVREDPEIFNKELVRNEMFKAMGYYVSESSGHNSEYNAWFRKRPDLIEKYCHGNGGNWNPGKYAAAVDGYLKREDTWEEETRKYLESDIVLKPRGNEYASGIFNAVFGDGELFKFNGNVRNFGMISNLPTGACVEVPCLVDKQGIQPTYVGNLPPQ
ncbi:MAG: alpha-glucosidase/alpha-galactosidase, partial [Clostridia bacterium]|nr:alpha-glucosidase/alpha-galactosidase [Clostridia bacterium]